MDTFSTIDYKQKLLSFIQNKKPDYNEQDNIVFNTTYNSIINDTNMKNKKIQEINKLFLEKVIYSFNKKNSTTQITNKNKLVPKVKVNLSTIDNSKLTEKINYAPLSELDFVKQNINDINTNPYFQPQVNTKPTTTTNSNDYQNNITLNSTSTIENSKVEYPIQSSNSIFQSQFQNNINLNSNNHTDNHSINKIKKSNYYIMIDSRDRDITIFPFHDHFQISLLKIYKNISSIKLENIIMPNIQLFNYTPYILLTTNEFDDIYSGSNTLYSKVFAHIYPNYTCKEQRFITFSLHNAKKKFKINTLSNLSKLSIRLLNSNGHPLMMPTDTFQIISIEFDGTNLYRMCVKNHPRNYQPFFYEWLTSTLLMYDLIYISGVPELRQPLHFISINKNNFDSFCSDTDPLIIIASSMKIPCVSVEEISFQSLFECGNTAYLSLNKITFFMTFRVKICEHEFTQNNS